MSRSRRASNVVEGRRMVESNPRKYERIVQLGTQKRSTPHVLEAIEHIRSGGLGKVSMARAWCHQKRENIGHGHPAEVPKGVDYAMWQGPAPERALLCPNRLHYNWHWFWHWGTGELGNNGIHGVDVARWGLGVDAPITVSSSGGKFFFDDDQETPDTQIATWEFPHCCLVCEHRIWSDHPSDKSLFGIAFLGNKGTLIVDDKGWRVEDGDGGKGARREEGQALHVQNFLDCVKSRQRPNADIEIGHTEHALCHLGNIAQRTGKKLTFDATTESFHDAQGRCHLLAREYSSQFAIVRFASVNLDLQTTTLDRMRFEPSKTSINMLLSPIGHCPSASCGHAGPFDRPGPAPAQHRPHVLAHFPRSRACSGGPMPRRSSARRSHISCGARAQSE